MVVVLCGFILYFHILENLNFHHSFTKVPILVYEFQSVFTLQNTKNIRVLKTCHQSQDWLRYSRYNQYDLHVTISTDQIKTVFELSANLQVTDGNSLIPLKLSLVSITSQMPRPRHKNKAIMRLSSHPSPY